MIGKGGVGRASVGARLAALAMLVAAASCVAAVLSTGGGEAVATGKTIPTLPPAGSDPDTSSAQPPAAPDTGIVLPADAGITQIAATAAAALATSDDIGDQLGAFAEVPDGIDSPAGASITELSVTYHPDDAADDSYFEANVLFTVPANSEDVAIFYQATLSEAFYEQTADEPMTGDDGGGSRRRLTFLSLNSEDGAATVVVVIPDGVDGGPTDDPIELTVVDHLDPSTVLAFTGWAAGLPALADGIAVGASFGADLTPAGALHLALSTTYYFDEEPDVLEPEFVAALPAFGFDLDAGRETVVDGDTTTVPLVHNILRNLTATFSPGADGGTSLVIVGETTI